MSLFAELKRRNVIRVGVAYLVATWLLMQMVDVLSQVLELPGWAPKLILLILVVGFIPVFIFSWAFEMTPEGIKREADVDRSESITNVTAKKLDYVTIGLLASAILIVAADRFLPKMGAESASLQTSSETGINPTNGEIPQAPAESIKEPPPKSVAVLPFVNMSDDASNEYFSDGISEEILNALAKVTDLKVAGRTSSFAFKGQNQDLREIGAALNVSHILEGSVRKVGNRVRVTAQLIKVADGYHIWSENYDRELDDVFAIQDEISASILQQLKAHLVGEETVKVARTDTRAYELYLLASQRIYERNQASLQMAADLLSQAIEIDPEYAPAHAQLGIATLLLSNTSYGTIPLEEAGVSGMNYLQNALRIEPENPDALAGVGLYYTVVHPDYEAAIEKLEQAVAINPNQVNARTWLSTAYESIGKLERSLKLQEETYAMDPLHPPTYNNLAQNYAVMGMSDKAMSLLRDLERYIPNDAGRFATVGKVEVMSGRWAEAERNLMGAVEREPLNFVDRLWLGAVLLGLGDYDRMVEFGTDSQRAIALSRLGRTEEALILAEKAVGNGGDMGRYFQVLVDNKRYAELIDFLESRWSDLDAFQTEWPSGDGYGDFLMGYIAQSYSHLGQEEKFDDAMNRFQTSLEGQLAKGADNWVLTWSRAHYALLAGDSEAAIALLDKAVTQGALVDSGMTEPWSIFSPLRGAPAYEAVKTRMLKHLNEERTELGLEPVSA
jgi:TolB-like protein/tetratricopeptide (TPR) repeat protein